MSEKLNFKTIEQPNRSIRIKVTEKCPWDCTFCHKEGGWGIDDIKWNQSTQQTIQTLKNILKLTEIHYTGGEPTFNKNLEELTIRLSSLGLKVKTTSNAQFSEEKLKNLINSGLKSFNFSIHGLQPEQLVTTQKNKSLRWTKKSIERQKKIILKAIELGAQVKINTVISNETDIDRALEIYNFAKKNRVTVRFLNDLNNGETAIRAIIKLAEQIIQAKKFKEKVLIGSSSKTSFYRDIDGYEFGVKEIRENKLMSLCKGCKERCTEQFYGIRLEKKDNKFFIRLCIDRCDEKSYMPFDKFLESDQLKEILKLIN